MKTLITLFVGLLALGTAAAQSPAQLKTELREKETAAAKDPDQLVEVGKWAEEKGLAAEARRIYQAALRIDPAHKAANEALGNELVEGKWLPPKEAAAARKKALDAQYKAAGMVEVGGVYVEKQHVDDAKRGIYHHDGEIVSKEEKVALMSGMVRHPETGGIIEARFLEKAQAKLFPIGTEGRWAELADANRYHADPNRPWVLRTAHGTLVSTLPLEKLQEIKQFMDRGIERLQPLFGFAATRPAQRPTVLVAATVDEYREYGSQFGDATSAYGAFLSRDGTLMKVPFQGEVRPAICHWETQNKLGPYYLRNAAGMSYVSGLCAAAGAEMPLWFQIGCGSYSSFFENDHDAGWFGKAHVTRGGVKDLESWFHSFAINGDMEATAISYNVYQAGLMISFAANGGDEKTTAAMQEITAAFASGKAKAVAKTMEKLQGLLAGKEDRIRAHLQTLISRFNG